MESFRRLVKSEYGHPAKLFKAVSVFYRIELNKLYTVFYLETLWNFNFYCDRYWLYPIHELSL